MISAIRAIVNHQNIVSSIDEVKINVEQTQEHTDYINNFLAPYLKSDYAPYFFAHENNQIFPGEKIINIITIAGDSDFNNSVLSGQEDNIIITGEQTITGNNTSNQWNTYLQIIGKSIQRGYESFL